MRKLRLYKDFELPIEKEPHLNLNSDCDRCSFSRYGGLNTVCMPAVGNPGGLLCISDYPGKQEDSVGPADGSAQAGQYLKKQLNKLWAGPVAITNAINCKPPKLDKDKSKVKIEKAIAGCRGYVAKTINDVKPQRIVCMGTRAVMSVFSDSLQVLSARRGVGWLWNDGDQIPIFILMNPVNALRNKFLKKWFESDLKWALTCDVDELPSPPINKFCYVIENFEDAREAIRAINKAGGFTFDTETSGRMHDDFFELLCLATTSYNTEKTWVWPGELIEQDDNVYNKLCDLMEDPFIAKCGHNIKYDVEVMNYVLEIDTTGIDFCTLLTRKLLWSNVSGKLEDMGYLVGMGGHKQEAQAALAAASKSLTKMRSKRKKAVGFLPGVESKVVVEATKTDLKAATYTYGMINRDLLYRYCALDSIATERLRQRLAPQVKNNKQVKHIWKSIVRNASEAVAQVETWGMPVSKEVIKSYDSYLSTQLEMIEKEFEPYNINLDSSQQVSELLYKKLKLPCKIKTEGGALSTDKNALKAIEDKHPLVQKLLMHRAVSKLKSSYAAGLLKFVRSDGRVHPSINLDGARTGRTSVKDPACFDDETEILTKDGWVKFSDYKQGTEVAQWDDGIITFVKPTHYIKKKYHGDIIHISNKHIDLCITADHRCLLFHRKTLKQVVVPASNYKKEYRQLHAGNYFSGTDKCDLSLNELRLICAAQADGHISHSGIDFAFKRKRKIKRLLNILKGLDANYSYNNSDKRGKTRIRLRQSPLAEKVIKYIGKDRLFGAWILDLPRFMLEYFCEEVFLWDGCSTIMNQYASTKKHNSDWVQIALTLCDKRARIRKYSHNRINPLHIVDITHRNYSSTKNVKKDITTVYNKLVYCVSVPSSFILTRRNNVTAITGNCQTIPTGNEEHAKLARSCFVALPGWKIVRLDFSNIELRISALLSGDKVMQQIFIDGRDYHTATAQTICKMVWGISEDQVAKKHRSYAKTLNFAVLYGSSDYSLAESLGLDPRKQLSEAVKIKNTLFGKMKDLKADIDMTVEEAKQTGFAYTWWDGKRARRRPIWQIASIGEDSSGARGNAERAAYNTKIQGTANDFCIASCIEAINWIKRDNIPAELIMLVHDELQFHVREDYVDEVARTAHGIMTSWNSGPVPLNVDIEVGPSWGETEEYKI